MKRGVSELARLDDDRTWAMLGRWSLAAAAAIVVHGGVVWLAVASQLPPSTPDEMPAVMIELAPVAVAPEEQPPEVAPGPQMVEAQPEPETPEQETPEDQKPDEPLPPTPVSEIKPPDLPKTDDTEALIAAPPPKPKPPRPRKPPPKVQEVERRRPIHPERPRVRQTTAPPAAVAPRAASAAAPAAGATGASSVSPATWRSSLVAHLNRYKRFPGGAAGAGTVTVAFTINRTGAVVGARLVASSGDSALDAEAVSLPRRASPVPAPPANMGSGAITLAVPIRFSR